jgi:hypothetical protein
MAGEARVRISLGTGDLEVEGTEGFVGQYDDAIQTLIERLKEQPAPLPTGGGGDAGGSARARSVDIAGREFGEVLHALPSNASGSDQMLVAGWYVQRATGDSTFSTSAANQLLLGQGIKLSNPSQSLKNAIAAKRVFKVGKGYKVSKTGEEYLKTLIGQL